MVHAADKLNGPMKGKTIPDLQNPMKKGTTYMSTCILNKTLMTKLEDK